MSNARLRLAHAGTRFPPRAPFFPTALLAHGREDRP